VSIISGRFNIGIKIHQRMSWQIMWQRKWIRVLYRCRFRVWISYIKFIIYLCIKFIIFMYKINHVLFKTWPAVFYQILRYEGKPSIFMSDKTRTANVLNCFKKYVV
jgi:hypothetical protein